MYRFSSYTTLQFEHDRNRKLFDDFVKHSESTRSFIEGAMTESKHAHLLDSSRRLGERFRNLLRQPKAYRWMICEWFYANIDQTLLGGENDFCTCLRETFPNLKTRKLTRTEWCKIRRLIGKPRRCSQAFFAEERALLSSKRKKIRQLQQQKVVDVNYFRDLPQQIPLSLVIGTRVTALLRQPPPYDGLQTGVIDAIDTANQGYRITFDDCNIGTLTVPDHEVLSNDSPEFLPLSSFQTRIKPRMPILKSPRFLEILGNEALCGGVDAANHSLLQTDYEEDANSPYPIKLLALMVRVSKILNLKKKRVYELKSMNDEVERLQSIEQRASIELKKSYASTILDLEKLNSDLEDHLKAVQIYSSELTVDSDRIPDIDLIRQKCSAEAKEAVESLLPKYEISNPSNVDVITHMVALLLHLKTFAANDDNALQLKALNDTIQEYKSKLKPEQVPAYEDNVEIHVNYIRGI